MLARPSLWRGCLIGGLAGHSRLVTWAGLQAFSALQPSQPQPPQLEVLRQ